MHTKAEERKAEIIDGVAAQLGTRLTRGEAALAERFVRVYYRDVAPEDLAERDPLDLDLPDDATDTFIGETSELHDAASAALAALSDESNRVAADASSRAHSAYASSSLLLVVLLLAGIAGGLVVAWLMARSLTSAVREAAAVSQDVANGKLDSHIDTSRADEIGDLLKSMQRMQRDLRERIERDQAIAGENLRIRTALDSSGTSVMIADPSRTVIYANAAATGLMRQYEDEIRSAVPEFDVDQVIGGSIDAYQALRSANAEATTATPGQNTAQ